MPRLLLIVLLMLLGACTHRPADSLYRDLDELYGITALVDELLDQLVEEQRIVARFADTDIGRFRRQLIDQFCELSGGPCRYTGESMRVVHAGHGIDEAEFNALVETLIAAMNARDIPLGVQNRLLARLAPMQADIVGR